MPRRRGCCSPPRAIRLRDYRAWRSSGISVWCRRRGPGAPSRRAGVRRLGTAGALAAALIATGATMQLDPWAWRHLVWPPIYQHDWGNFLRVFGTIYFWLPVAAAVWLEGRAHAPDRARRAWLLFVAPALAGGVAELLKMLVRRERPGLHDGAYVFRAFNDRPFR